MRQFYVLLCFGLKRRAKDFFVLFYNILFPAVVILLLGYLTSGSYGSAFTSYHYYTITVISFCALMGVSTVSYAAQDEKLLHTSSRFLAAPVGRIQIVAAKFLSCAIVLSACNIVTFFIARLLFRLDFGGNLFMVFLLLGCETAAVTGIGLFLGLACKDLNTLRNFLNIPILLFGFLGGAFFPVSSFHPALGTLLKLSPLTWVNRGIISYLYDSQTRLIAVVSALLLAAGLAMTALTVRFFKKEALL